MTQQQPLLDILQRQGHVLRTLGGQIDTGAYWDGHGHAGPACVNCGDYWCLCHTDPSIVQQCPGSVRPRRDCH